MNPRRIDLFAAVSAVLAVVMAGVYVGVMRDQGDDPLAWVVAVLVVGAVLAAYGAARWSPFRQVALAMAVLLLGALGLLAILSIGLPILAAAALALVALVRAVGEPRPT